MIALTIRAPELAPLARRFATADVPAALRQAENQWSTQELDALRRATPYRPGPGPHAREAWRAERTQEGTTITNAVPHALYLITGTRAHQIAAPPGGVLRWLTEGQPTYARSVSHPGTQPIRALVEVMDQAPEEATRALEAAAERLAEHLAHGGA